MRLALVGPDGKALGRKRAVIDRGGLSAGTSNFAVAQHLRALLEAASVGDEDGGPKGVMYWDASEIKMVLPTGGAPGGGTGAEPLAASRIKEHEVLVFYDEKHCRGSDVKMLNGVTAVMTLSNNGLQKDNFMQAVGRLRKFEKGKQSVSFYAPEELKSQLEAFGAAGGGINSGLAVEGGGQRSLILAVSVWRGLEKLAEKSGDPARRHPKLAAGVSGGSWGVAALTYSDTLLERIGEYLELSQLSVEKLVEKNPKESLTHMLDPEVINASDLWSPIKGKDKVSNFLRTGPVEALMNGLDLDARANEPDLLSYWENFASYYLYQAGVDPMLDFAKSWCEEAGTGGSCQRRDAPYPIFVAADVDNQKRGKNDFAPLIEYMPQKVRLQMTNGAPDVTVSTNKYGFQCPDMKASGPSHVDLQRHLQGFTKPEYYANGKDFWQKFCTTGDGTADGPDGSEEQPATTEGRVPIAQPTARSSYVPGMERLGVKTGDFSGGVGSIAQHAANTLAPVYTDAHRPAEGGQKIKQESGDGGAADLTAVLSLLRNGANRIISLQAKKFLNEGAVKKFAAMSAEDFLSYPKDQVVEELSMLPEGAANKPDPALDLLRWFGYVDSNNPQNQIFPTDKLQCLLNDFAQRVWAETGIVGTVSLKTVSNQVRGIEEGRRVVLTVALMLPQSGWVNAVNAKLIDPKNPNDEKRTFNMETKCVGDTGPFNQGIWNISPVPCTRLLAHMYTWHVVQNPDDFDFQRKFDDTCGKEVEVENTGEPKKCVKESDETCLMSFREHLLPLVITHSADIVQKGVLPMAMNKLGHVKTLGLPTRADVRIFPDGRWVFPHGRTYIGTGFRSGHRRRSAGSLRTRLGPVAPCVSRPDMPTLSRVCASRGWPRRR